MYVLNTLVCCTIPPVVCILFVVVILCSNVILKVGILSLRGCRNMLLPTSFLSYLVRMYLYCRLIVDDLHIREDLQLNNNRVDV